MLRRRNGAIAESRVRKLLTPNTTSGTAEDEWLQLAEELTELDAVVEAAHAKAKGLRAQTWRSWANEALNGGASATHRCVCGKTAWGRAGCKATRSRAGRPDHWARHVPRRGPRAVGHAVGREARAARSRLGLRLEQELGSLPRLPPLDWVQLKAASALFQRRTAKGVDGFHVTAFQHLGEGG